MNMMDKSIMMKVIQVVKTQCTVGRQFLCLDLVFAGNLRHGSSGYLTFAENLPISVHQVLGVLQPQHSRRQWVRECSQGDKKCESRSM